jgi:SAM-dependent methyltransferase
VGQGEPSVKKLNQKMLKKGWNALRKGQVMRLVNKGLAMAVNTYQFTLRRGKKTAECPCCGWQGPAFLATSPGRRLTLNSACPRCDSRSRHRGLALLLPALLGDQPGAFLLFAPEKVILDVLSKTPVTVSTTDLDREDVDLPGEDMQHLTFPDAAYNALLANHVLEHIPDDARALRECFRVLKPGGIALFTVAGDFSQQETQSLKAPDWLGHYRTYGLDVLDLFRQAGFDVEAVDMGADADPKWGVTRGDMLFVGRKG